MKVILIIIVICLAALVVVFGGCFAPQYQKQVNGDTKYENRNK
jgi:uncharacterized protein YneF (UPF0154 family)